MSDPTTNVVKVMSGLKDFQRTSVDYVFRRMYTDSDPTRRFLLADEVGLGKTMVAKGVIAKTIEHLRAAGVPRIDVLYICSNLDIARQNIERLNVTPEATVPLASRITLLPKMVHDLKDRPLNFVTFTPGTSFNLRSSLGTMEERVMLHWMLREIWSLPDRTGPRNLLREIQRFRDLLDSEDDVAVLARNLFEWGDAQILLLSATPHKMLTLSEEDGGEDAARRSAALTRLRAETSPMEEKGGAERSAHNEKRPRPAF